MKKCHQILTKKVGFEGIFQKYSIRADINDSINQFTEHFRKTVTVQDMFANLSHQHLFFMELNTKQCLTELSSICPAALILQNKKYNVSIINF